MEECKRKFLFEPVQEQGTSKYGRKVSKYVFKVVQNSSAGTKPPLKSPLITKTIKTEEYSPSVNEQIDPNFPSIVLCRPDSSLDESVLEQQFDITHDSVIKKFKIIPSCKIATPDKYKPKFSKRGKYNSVLGDRKGRELSLTQPTISKAKVGKIKPLKRPPVDNEINVKIEKSASKLEVNEEKVIHKKIEAEEARLKAEHGRLSKLLTDLKHKAAKVLKIELYQKERITLTKLKNNHEMLYYYIGFKDLSLLDSMVEKLKEYFVDKETTTDELLLEDQLIMVLMKLRRNYSMHDLAFRFRVSVSQADCIVFNVILALHNIYYENGLKQTPFPLPNLNLFPEQFRNFPNCRVVLECVKIGCEDPDTESEADTFTSAKFDPKVTLKGLLGISPCKHVLFASGLYEDSSPNTEIFKDSAIIDKLQAGDLIMADKSFEILDCISCDMDLNVPASSKTHLTDKQFRNLNSKARAFIGRTTMQHIRRFCILNHIPIFLNSIAVQVFQLCSALVNFQPTITTPQNS